MLCGRCSSLGFAADAHDRAEVGAVLVGVRCCCIHIVYATQLVLCITDLAVAAVQSPFEVASIDTTALWCLQASKRLIRPHVSTVPAEVATTAAPSVTPQRSLPLPKRPLPAPGMQPPAPAVAAQLALDLLSPQASSSMLSPRQGFGLGRGSSAEVPPGILSPRQMSGGSSSSTALPVGIPSPRQMSGGRSSSTVLPVDISTPRQMSGGKSSSTTLPAGVPSPQQGPAQRRRTKAELQSGILSPHGHGRDGRSGSALSQVSPSSFKTCFSAFHL